MNSITRQIGKHFVTVELSGDLVPRQDGKTGRAFFAFDIPDYSKLKKPEKGFGIYLPAIFKVTGLPCEITFTLDQIKVGKPEFGITKAELVCSNGLIGSSIPWPRLRSMAITSASFVGIHYPPNFKESGENWSFDAGKTGAFIASKNAVDLPQKTRNLILGSNEKLVGAELYKRIAEIWLSAPHGKTHKVIASEFGFSEKWSHKHTAIGKKDYPQFFKLKKKQTKNKRTNK